MTSKSVRFPVAQVAKLTISPRFIQLSQCHRKHIEKRNIIKKNIGRTKGGISNENEKKDTRSAMLWRHVVRSIEKGKNVIMANGRFHSEKVRDI